jgi:BlaI family penicillinase repressor
MRSPSEECAMSGKGPSISGTELEVLKALWDDGPGTVREINDRLSARGRQWAYTTVQTLLNRLCAKGVVSADKRDVAHIYQPTVSRDELLNERLQELAGELCEGASAPLVLALVQGKRFTKNELRQFRNLLEELEKK